MTTFFTSDLHLGHQNIITYTNRPFSSVEEMNEGLINNWNGVVSNDDDVYILGDLCMGKINETLPLVELLKGNKKLIPGNHDRCWFGGKPKGREEWVKKYKDVGLEILGNGVDEGCGVVDLSHLFPGEKVEGCHFPFYGDSQNGDRYSAYRPVDKGQFLLHGHTHSNETFFEEDGDNILTKMIHVGVDSSDLRPLNISNINSAIQTIKIMRGE